MRMFGNDPIAQGSIPGEIIPKIQKMVLEISLHYKAQSKGMWTNPAKGVGPSPRLQCSGYWKGSLRLALRYRRPNYIYIYAKIRTHTHTQLYIYIYIYIIIMSNLDPLTPLFPIVHRLWLVFRATSRILTELLYVCSSWSFCISLYICGGP